MKEKKALSITTLIIGIISVLVSCCGAGFVGITSIIIGIIAIKKEKKNAMSITGIVLSVVAIIISFVIVIILGFSFLERRQNDEAGISTNSEHVHQVGSLDTESQILEQENEIEQDVIMPNVGDYVLFGTYEQDGIYDNGSEPIEWKVLEVEGDKVLLISRYVLDAKPFHTYDENTLWEECTLRQWLNNDFYNAAFTDADKSNIIESTLENPDNTYRGVAEGGNATVDKVFILSWDELIKYFPDGVWIEREGNNIRFSEDTICKYTEYAKDQGLSTCVSIREYEYESNFSQYGYSLLYVEDSVATKWWLRTPGVCYDVYGNNNKSSSFLYVDYWGRNTLYYNSNVNKEDVGVRPAIWVEYDNNMEISFTAEEMEQYEMEAWEQREAEEQMAFEAAEYENEIIESLAKEYDEEKWYEMILMTRANAEKFSLVIGEKYLIMKMGEQVQLLFYTEDKVYCYEYIPYSEEIKDSVEERWDLIKEEEELVECGTVSMRFMGEQEKDYYGIYVLEISTGTVDEHREEHISNYEELGYSIYEASSLGFE